MKSLIKKITVFVLALALMVSTASTVLASGGTGKEPGPGGEGTERTTPPLAPWGGPSGK